MTSDNICPWCYIGKRRLERAIAELDPARVTVRIRMHPFFLDATLPPSSVNKMEHYKKKFGAERAAQMIPRMQATGREEGIAFSYGGNIGNTLLSHRLVRYTERTRPDATNGLVDALFRAYFEEEKDIADIPTLAAIAASQGFDEAVVAEYLRGREDEAAVQNEVINAYRQGIDGVPNFKSDDHRRRTAQPASAPPSPRAHRALCAVLCCAVLCCADSRISTRCQEGRSPPRSSRFSKDSASREGQ